MKPTASQYARVLLALSQESPASAWPQTVESFLGFLRRQRDTKKLPVILRDFQRRLDATSGRRRVKVTAAVPINDAALQVITEQAQTLLSAHEVTVSVVADPQALGGIALQTDTERFDATLRRRLSEIQKALSK